MKRSVGYLFLLALVAVATANAVYAQGGQTTPQAATTAPAVAASARAEALQNFNDAADKLLRLAEAVPAEKYTWRPGEGVRSISEVYLHVAAGNFSIPRRLGAQVPANIQLSPTFDKQTTEKAKVLEILKQSVEHVRAAFTAVTDADLEKTAPWFGNRQASYREIMFFICAHNHEHLGQSIAYARMNGITPPWTEEQQQRQQQPAKKQP